jgi:hypothetical protein
LGLPVGLLTERRLCNLMLLNEPTGLISSGWSLQCALVGLAVANVPKRHRLSLLSDDCRCSTVVLCAVQQWVLHSVCSASILAVSWKFLSQ